MKKSIAYLTLASDASGTPVNNPLSGDEFVVRLEPPLRIPRGGQILPVRATSWHTSPNISAARANNKFSYTAVAPAPNPGVYVLTIPDGLYSVASLQGEIANQMATNGHGTILTPAFTFTGLVATQKVQITMTSGNLGYSIDFTIANSIRDVIGFTSIVIGPPVAVPTTYTGANLADFPQGVNSQIVNLSIVYDGYIGGTSANALFEIPLSSTSPNSQVSSQNICAYQVPCDDGNISVLRVWLSDQSGRLIGLNNNPYSISIAIVVPA